MAKRPSNKPLDQAKRVKIVGQLASIPGVSKTGLSKTLSALHDRGLLTDDLSDAPSDKGYMRQINNALDLDAHADTPYGPIVNEMTLPIEGEGYIAAAWWELDSYNS